MAFPNDYKIVRIAGGPNIDIMSIVGLDRQILINTTDYSVHVTDGVTPGGIKTVTSAALTSMLQSDSPVYLPKGNKTLVEEAVAPVGAEIQTSMSWTPFQLKTLFAKFMNVSNQLDWTVLNAALPSQLRTDSPNVNNLNDAVASGFYIANPSTALNLPAGINTSNSINIGLMVISQNVNNCVQVLFDRFISGRTYTRSKIGGVFGAWTLVGALNNIFSGVKNLLRNPLFVVDQRGLSAGVSTNGQYPVDGWRANFAFVSTPPTLVYSRVAGTGAFALKMQVTANPKAALAAGDLAITLCSMEGFDSQHLRWGTAFAKPLAIAGRVKASVAGTYTLSVRNGASDWSYLIPIVCAANQWTDVNHIIPAKTDGAWIINSGAGLVFSICHAAGVTFQGTDGWNNSNKVAVNAQANSMATLNATVEIEEFRLSIGEVIPVEVLPFVLEEARCQRYYESGNYRVVNSHYSIAGSALSANVEYKVKKRAAPSVAATTTYNLGFNAGNPTIQSNESDGFSCAMIAAATGANVVAYIFSWTATAEL